MKNFPFLNKKTAKRKAINLITDQQNETKDAQNIEILITISNTKEKSQNLASIRRRSLMGIALIVDAALRIAELDILIGQTRVVSSHGRNLVGGHRLGHHHVVILIIAVAVIREEANYKQRDDDANQNVHPGVAAGSDAATVAIRSRSRVQVDATDGGTPHISGPPDRKRAATDTATASPAAAASATSAAHLI